jgi:hypothetical protein
MKELNWFKSSYSSANGQCVECALLPGGGMAVRDTQSRDGDALSIPAAAWQQFTASLR